MSARGPVSIVDHRPAPDETVTIDRVGAEGDGIATAADGATLYIPNTLPDETVRAERLGRKGNGWAARATAIQRESEARVTPLCQHFGACGGCVLQHWRDTEYRAWKTGLLETALHRAGFAEPPIARIAVTPPGSRRRMDLAARRLPRGVVVGLHARVTDAAKRSDARVRTGQTAVAVCDLAECHVLHPVLFALIAPLRLLLTRLQALRRDASIIANLLDHGIDLLLRTDALLDRADRTRLIEFARSHGLLRVAWEGLGGEPEPVVILRPPLVTLAGVPVEQSPGGFLQASREGEAAIVQAVLAGLPEPLPARTRVAEFYAGSGSLTFALAQRARVAAWEGDGAAVAALRQAANRAGLAGRITVAQRDLARQPVSAAELSGFAAVVLDPPFAGASAQTVQIAAAKPACVIYVSCNPAALARDARTLREAEYKLLAATPVDQFLWSARLESICVFRRG